MLRFTWISSSLLSEDNDDTFPPDSNYSESVTDFLLFTVPMNEPASILSFILISVLLYIPDRLMPFTEVIFYLVLNTHTHSV